MAGCVHEVSQPTGTEPVVELVLAPESADVIIDKFGYGAFHGTALANILNSR
jgi:nicotinamidase-related amidase